MSNGNNISREAIVHPGCRIIGSSIGPGCEIGAEGAVVIENCQLGRGVKLKGGYFSGSVFLDGANMGGGAHVREGTILEEEASGAHAVGLKQTVLLPFVTLGSLINFCDILMAGGTSRKNHSEVGSSYIHFNFTPNQDKATASLVGDVSRGVLLNQNPIFLGGQGGLVGPARIAYGTVIAAGGIYTGADIAKYLEMGASGVQMGTRFVATHECDADMAFKQAFLNARREDITVIKSPVGMPGRAILNEFLLAVREGRKKPFKCPFHCIKSCDFTTTPYCISQALVSAKKGILKHGFAFCGENVWRVDKIMSVKELMGGLKQEFEEFWDQKMAQFANK